MDNFIKIKGLSRIILKDIEKPIAGKDYLISVKASLSGIEKDLEDEENPYYVFMMKYLSTEQVLEVGSSHKLKVENGRTPSQKLRFTLMALAKAQGLDPEEFYQSEISRLIEEYSLKLE